MPIQNALTVDVEDYYHVSAFERDIQREDWGSYPSRVVQNTRRILTILQRGHVTATFFVLGWVADRYPDLVREIDNAGHEIGSHGYWHRQIYTQSPDEFRKDLRESIAVLEDLIDKPVTSFRAPTFSITRRSLWALDILAEEGIQVDSSIFPIRHDRYGIPLGEDRLHIIDTPSGQLWEFPMSTVTVAGRRIPIGGGGYFRMYPFALTIRGLESINRRHGAPFMFYIHPWEIDPEQPRVAGPKRIAQFRHRLNLSQTAEKLERLLLHFRFGTVKTTIDAYKAVDKCTIRVPSDRVGSGHSISTYHLSQHSDFRGQSDVSDSVPAGDRRLEFELRETNR
jgi:polysaccharide deacetylase family protein (PEP-CTERM system associated)